MNDMTIYDTIEAGTIEDGDQILWQDDVLENVVVTNLDRDYITVTGYSHNTGDKETYEIPVDSLVDLWMV
jgi:hypothetical protein